MRIACVHVPQFALQSLTRTDPSLRGAPVVVVGAPSLADRPLGAPALVAPPAGRALHAPVIQACSRAAWALGARVGMTAAAAHALAPGQLRVVTADPASERETVRAIADALLGVSSVVDVGGRLGAGGAHLALYCEVPSKTRGTSFGEKLLEVLAALGVSARIGIADDRFTAWVAAAHGAPVAGAGHGAPAGPGAHGDEPGVVAVPRGGSAAFLAPRPLSLLAISPEVQHVLEALGVRTLGEFAALPAPSVARPVEADYQALARGDSGHALRPYAPEAPIREVVVCGPALSGPAAVGVLARRIAARLAGRGRGAARLEIVAARPDGEHRGVITPLLGAVAPMARLAAEPGAGPASGRVLETQEEIAEALGHTLADDLAVATRIEVAVTGEALAGDEVAAVAAPAIAPAVEPLRVVLSTTGSAAWQLTSPVASEPSTLRSERRDAHRRTRRGKQLRRAREVDGIVQPRLFADGR